MAKDKTKETPLMQQYNVIKAKYPGALLLFRVGDFYETFGEDAIKASGILGITLTKRANGSATHTELAGFQHHSLDTYLSRLVRAGQRVAICDQLEDPKSTKTIVKRGVTELVTPGVAYGDNILSQKSNNYLAAVFFDKAVIGVSFADISTGEFHVAQGNAEYIDKLLQGFKPTEVVFQKSKRKELFELFGDKFYNFPLDDWAFTADYANETLNRHFEVNSLKGFGVEKLQAGIVAAGVVLYYLNETEHRNLKHITSISRLEEDNYMWLDRFTVRNLELVSSANENAMTLFNVLDQTSTPMGARMLHKWIVMPLKELKPIQERLGTVEFMVGHEELLAEFLTHIKQIGDLERLISKVGLLRCGPRELCQLKKSLYHVEAIKNIALKTNNPYLIQLAEELDPCFTIREKLERELQQDPPALLVKGNVIADGIDEELDKLRSISTGGKDFLVEIQKREAAKTGIPSLKISFNNVFGYYLEVTHTHKDKVPAEWSRKQTLVNAERYITPELKEYEEQILGAEDKIQQIEVRLYEALMQQVATYIRPIQRNAFLVAQLDVMLCFAQLAISNHYVKPELNSTKILDIKGARHPVIEKRLPTGEEYITNDVFLDNDTQQIIIITGPNMSGKSAILRQTGIIVLMAQMGSFVPAKAATIGIVDKIFTRVGASDNLSAGESTFMV
ncbi:MAG TPA: DNA mismatch repair protein MutS, partial [Pedobacter sp.]